jgi:5-methylthioadenosine/S-adenosylhomocysteine deaminase
VTAPGGEAEEPAGQPARTRYRAEVVVPLAHSNGVAPVLRPGVVEVVGDRVVHVGTSPMPTPSPSPSASGQAASSDVREVRVEGALLPGLVNVHCHSPMTLFRGSGEGLALHRWLTEVLWPMEAHLTEEDVYWGMTLAAAELLRFGVTTSCEMYFHEDALADAVVAAGSRAVVTPAVLVFEAEQSGRWWERRIAEIVAFHSRRHGQAGRIEVGFAPHAPYSVPFEALTEAAGAARQLGALYQIHLAETEDECHRFRADHGRSETAKLADLGVLEARVLAAHGIWLSPDDIDLCRQFDVAVAHCPSSNAKLASGIAPLADLLGAGLRVGLGTDGPASNNDLDLWEEVRLAVMLARLRTGDPGALGSAAAWDLATRGAGLALGRPDLGVLAEGSVADMMAVDLDDPVFVPLLSDSQLVDHLVWAASSRLVTDVWVAGRQVVADRRCLTVDVDETRRQVESRARRLRAAAAG